MRCVNEAIIRERIPMPAVDEVLENLNGSTMFSKLDLRLGFYQLKLDENSRDITTFAIHDGLFRYKRLMFGVNSASEKYQQIFRQALSGISGVHNIADDLVVHGKNQEEHDRNLHSVIRRLEQKNLTLTPTNPLSEWIKLYLWDFCCQNCAVSLTWLGSAHVSYLALPPLQSP